MRDLAADLELFRDIVSTGKDHEGCQGYKTNTIDGIEYDCRYEFSGELDCDECIFGTWGGTKDPRIKHNEEED